VTAHRRERHGAILRLIRERPISTQTELADALREAGYDDYWVFEVGWEQAQASIQGWRYLKEKYG
jgi:hypothetical protein